MKNIFVGNLSFGATEDAVRSMFESYGTVDRVSLVTDRDTGQARGFGFVEMTNDAEAERGNCRTERPGTRWPGAEHQRSASENRSCSRRRWRLPVRRWWRRAFEEPLVT